MIWLISLLSITIAISITSIVHSLLILILTVVLISSTCYIYIKWLEFKDIFTFSFLKEFRIDFLIHYNKDQFWSIFILDTNFDKRLSNSFDLKLLNVLNCEPRNTISEYNNPLWNNFIDPIILLNSFGHWTLDLKTYLLINIRFYTWPILGKIRIHSCYETKYPSMLLLSLSKDINSNNHSWFFSEW